MSSDAQSIVNTASFQVDDKVYAVIGLHPGAILLGASIAAEVGEPFVALLVDSKQVTLIMPTDLVVEFEGRLREYQLAETRYRLITLDLPLPETLVGLMALVSQTLASADLPMLAMSGHSYDHFLVPEDRLSDALVALNSLKTP